MTARLPTPGQDDGVWGNILNDYLSQAHNTDGTLKSGTVGTAQIQDSTITTAKITDNAITSSKIPTATISDSHISPTAAITKTKLAPSIQSSLTAADTSISKPPATLDGKLVKWNNTSGQLEDGTALVSVTPVPLQTTAPDPATYTLWRDSSVAPAILKQWDGSSWTPLVSQDDAAGLAILAGLGVFS